MPPQAIESLRPTSMTGNPGISGGLTEYVEQRVGDVVGFFLHDGVTMDGQNAEFNIVDIRFGRIMEIDLTGSPKNKRLVIQPATYSGPGVLTNSAAPSSEGMVVYVGLGA